MASKNSASEENVTTGIVLKEEASKSASGWMAGKEQKWGTINEHENQV